MTKRVRVLSIVLIAILVSFPIFLAINVQRTSGSGFTPTSIPPSMTLLGAGAKWAAQNGTQTLFIDWEDNYLAHGNTDGVNWGPWPSETDMKNWTDSITYMLNQSGLNVTLAGDIPIDLTGYNLLVIHAYWACTPALLEEVANFIAGGGGVVLLSGVPEMFRTYCKDWWTYNLPTDPLSVGEGQIFACDGNYLNTGGYANVTVDNPFNTSLMAGDTLFESTGYSNAAVGNPYNGSQVIAEWNPALYNIPDWNITVAFAYTYQYGLGRVYYQASFTPLDPPNHILADINRDGKVDITDVATVCKAFGSKPGASNWNPNSDLNFDGKIDMEDIALASRSFGKHSP
jgi:hypothetical protein